LRDHRVSLPISIVFRVFLPVSIVSYIALISRIAYPIAQTLTRAIFLIGAFLLILNRL